jgi:hypothetical protein
MCKGTKGCHVSSLGESVCVLFWGGGGQHTFRTREIALQNCLGHFGPNSSGSSVVVAADVTNSKHFGRLLCDNRQSFHPDAQCQWDRILKVSVKNREERDP